MASALSRFDRASLLNGTPEQQELLGERGFTRIRVRNDGEGTAPSHLLGDREAAHQGRCSGIDISCAERILFDERTPGLDIVTHQRAEDLIGCDGIFDLHLEKTAHL